MSGGFWAGFREHGGEEVGKWQGSGGGVGEHHAEGGAGGDRGDVVEAGGQGDGGDLGFIAHFDEEEADHGGEEGAMLAGGFRGVGVVELVGDEGPDGHGDEAGADGEAKGAGGEQAGDRAADIGGHQVVRHGGAEDAGDDAPGLAEAAGQHDGEQHGLVAHFGEGDGAGAGGGDDEVGDQVGDEVGQEGAHSARAR